MLTPEESKILKTFLALAPEPDETFSYDELMGYLYGLAITPDIVLPSEWIPLIFNGTVPAYDSLDQVDTMNRCLMNVFNRLTAEFHNNTLDLPFDIRQLDRGELEKLYEWISGFEEALALRDDLWDPEQHPHLPEQTKHELYHSLMTIQGLVEPMDVMDFFENLPDEVFEEAFPGMENEFESRELQIQMFLLASLPLSIQTLQKHAANLLKRQKQTGKTPASATTGTKKSRKDNIIQVDFSKHKK